MQTTTTKAFHFTIFATVSQISPPDFYRNIFDFDSRAFIRRFMTLTDPREIDHLNDVQILQFYHSIKFSVQLILDFYNYTLKHIRIKLKKKFLQFRFTLQFLSKIFHLTRLHFHLENILRQENRNIKNFYSNSHFLPFHEYPSERIKIEMERENNFSRLI